MQKEIYVDLNEVYIVINNNLFITYLFYMFMLILLCSGINIFIIRSSKNIYSPTLEKVFS